MVFGGRNLASSWDCGSLRRFGLSALALLVVAAATAGGVLLISQDEGGSGGHPATTTGSSSSPPHPGTSPNPGTAHRGEPSDGAGAGRAGGPAGSTRHEVHVAVAESKRAHLDADQRRVAGVARAYVAALNAGDGARACRQFAPGALESVHFPRNRGSCATSLSASIGYRDPRGFPVFAGSRIARIPTVSIHGNEGRVTATTVTRFADNREPSIEDDIVYLRRVGGRWLIVKPSATLLRAIGVGNIPPRALAPP
jgi:hypothetical protein